MSKLVSANFSRLFRNKFFWICLALVLGVAAFIAINFRLSYPWCTKQFGNETNEVCFKYIPILTGIAALFVSLFIGEEYSNKTIRNKIASGYSKTKIYGANWLVCAIVSILFYVAFFLTVALPIAPWESLMKYNGYIIARILKHAAAYLLPILVVVSISVFITMLVKNRIVSVVVTMVCMFVLLLSSELMWGVIGPREFMTITDTITGAVTKQPNPYYENGIKKEIMQVIMDVQPFGQMLQVRMGRTEGARGILLPVYACLMSVVMSFGGAYLFGKKDLE